MKMEVEVSNFEQDLRDSIGADSLSRGIKGLDKTAQVVVKNIRSTFDTEGQRGENPAWIPTFYLKYRKNYPWGKGSSLQSAYMANAKTLIDTGFLQKSIDVLLQSQDKNGANRVISAKAPYGYKHEFGGNTFLPPFRERKLPGKRIELPKRPHMYIALSELSEMDRAFREGSNQ